MSNYFDHNAVREGLRRVRASADIYVRFANVCFPASATRMPRAMTEARRIEGADLRTRHAWRDYVLYCADRYGLVRS